MQVWHNAGRHSCLDLVGIIVWIQMKKKLVHSFQREWGVATACFSIWQESSTSQFSHVYLQNGICVVYLSLCSTSMSIHTIPFNPFLSVWCMVVWTHHCMDLLSLFQIDMCIFSVTKLKESLKSAERFLQEFKIVCPNKKENIIFYGFADVKSLAALEIAYKMGYTKWV